MMKVVFKSMLHQSEYTLEQISFPTSVLCSAFFSHKYISGKQDENKYGWPLIDHGRGICHKEEAQFPVQCSPFLLKKYGDPKITVCSCWDCRHLYVEIYMLHKHKGIRSYICVSR